MVVKGKGVPETSVSVTLDKEEGQGFDTRQVICLEAGKSGERRLTVGVAMATSSTSVPAAFVSFVLCNCRLR